MFKKNRSQKYLLKTKQRKDQQQVRKQSLKFGQKMKQYHKYSNYYLSVKNHQLTRTIIQSRIKNLQKKMNKDSNLYNSIRQSIFSQETKKIQQQVLTYSHIIHSNSFQELENNNKYQQRKEHEHQKQYKQLKERIKRLQLNSIQMISRQDQQKNKHRKKSLNDKQMKNQIKMFQQQKMKHQSLLRKNIQLKNKKNELTNTFNQKLQTFRSNFQSKIKYIQNQINQKSQEIIKIQNQTSQQYILQKLLNNQQIMKQIQKQNIINSKSQISQHSKEIIQQKNFIITKLQKEQYLLNQQIKNQNQMIEQYKLIIDQMKNQKTNIKLGNQKLTKQLTYFYHQIKKQFPQLVKSIKYIK